MIKSFRNVAACAAWERRFIKGVPQEVLRIGNRKLTQLHNARSLTDLRAPPGNRLEALNEIRDKRLRRAISRTMLRSRLVKGLKRFGITRTRSQGNRSG